LVCEAHIRRLPGDPDHLGERKVHPPFSPNGREPIKNLIKATRYLRLAADQGHAEAQCHFAVCLLTGQSVNQDIARAIQYFKYSAENSNPNGQFVVAYMSENGIAMTSNLNLAVQYYKKCSEFLPKGSVSLGGVCKMAKEPRSISQLLLNVSRKHPISMMLMGLTVLPVVWSKEKGLLQILSWPFGIIEEALHFIKPMDFITLDAVLSIGRGLSQIYIGQRNTIIWHQT
jgi:hypothetical protein